MREPILDLYQKLYATDLCWANLEDMAQRLSTLVDRSRPWTAKFLDSLIHGYKGYEDYHSESLALALSLLKAQLENGAQAMIVSRSAVISYVSLPPGTIIQGNVVRCPCGVYFVPAWASQKYHTKNCKRKAYYERRKLSSSNKSVL